MLILFFLISVIDLLSLFVCNVVVYLLLLLFRMMMLKVWVVMCYVFGWDVLVKVMIDWIIVFVGFFLVKLYGVLVCFLEFVMLRCIYGMWGVLFVLVVCLMKCWRKRLVNEVLFI